MELNAEQIKKALECCSGTEDDRLNVNCNECPFEIGKNECRSLDSLALSLINELTEENDKLKVLNKLHEQDVDDYIEQLEKKVEEVYPEFIQDYKCMREELDGVYDEYKELREENERLRGERDAYAILKGEMATRNSELQLANEELGEHCIALEKELNERSEVVRRRMHHLFRSKFIASFDEIDPKTKEYKRDIAEADKLVEENERLRANGHN